ncbi:MAG: hypothetical protein MUE44_27005 [Oscillatoriaceae cyanobacterium Prado104]|nr:hypothetical protein [Oscillatoriaceae cyanobacterium Prado104]
MRHNQAVKGDRTWGKSGRSYLGKIRAIALGEEKTNWAISPQALELKLS